MKNDAYLLMVQVFQEKYFEDAVIALTQAGAKDVFSMAGMNETRRLPHNIPIFVGFRGELGKASSMNKVFFAVASDPEIPRRFLAAMKLADINFLEDDLGSMTLIPTQSFSPVVV